MYLLGGSSCRLPSQGHEVQALLLARLEGFLKLPVMGLLRRHARLTHRNVNVFFLQWVGHRNVEGRGLEASVVLLYRDVAGLLLGACDLVFLLDHHRREASSFGGMTEDVAQVVVPKHARGAVVAAESVVAENVHLAFACVPDPAKCGAGEGRVEKGEAQAELKGRAEGVGGLTQVLGLAEQVASRWSEASCKPAADWPCERRSWPSKRRRWPDAARSRAASERGADRQGNSGRGRLPL